MEFGSVWNVPILQAHAKTELCVSCSQSRVVVSCRRRCAPYWRVVNLTKPAVCRYRLKGTLMEGTPGSDQRNLTCKKKVGLIAAPEVNVSAEDEIDRALAEMAAGWPRK